MYRCKGGAGCRGIWDVLSKGWGRQQSGSNVLFRTVLVRGEWIDSSKSSDSSGESIFDGFENPLPI